MLCLYGEKRSKRWTLISRSYIELTFSLIANRDKVFIPIYEV
jgi:hypothetical protein